jgi:cell division septum initiation protein DivIVA
MDTRDLRAEAERLRSAQPSRAVRGFDEEQTRRLLEDAATLLEVLAGEHEETKQECERLRSAAAEQEVAKEAIGSAFLTATRAGEEIAAEARASAERIVAEAEARAATIFEQAAAKEAELERDRLSARRKLEEELAAARAAVGEENAARKAELEHERTQLVREQEAWREGIERERARTQEEAQARADAIVADARLEVERLQRHAQRLRSLLAESQRHFVDLAESALRQLVGIETKHSGSGDVGLLDDLRPQKLDETSSPSTVAAPSLD